ncbi:hypothetical protein BC827DRAFT_1159151 [Russula dissimulans]|nr:hypothetical protein BC827DRAFT_1159151 [Russula dissimulans]
MRTNLKNVAEQYEHLSFVSSLIRNQINEVNASSDEYDISKSISIQKTIPKFHNQEQHDFVIVQTTTGCIFAQLLLIFFCSISGTTFAICSIQPLDALIRAPPTKDRELGLCCVRAQNEPEFIFARSIDFDKQGDYFVMDVVDHTGDMFLRCEEILPQ